MTTEEDFKLVHEIKIVPLLQITLILLKSTNNGNKKKDTFLWYGNLSKSCNE
jgi:hypothetical protein